MIRRQGFHVGRRILFGYDRYVLPDLEIYRGYLGSLGSEVTECVADRLHYLTSAALVCQELQEDPDAFGILCCGTGIGMSIAANKFSGVYAARCTTVDDARSAREINNANLLCFGANLGVERNLAILETFAVTPYNGRKIDELEHIVTFEHASPAAPRPRRAIRRIA